MTYIEKRFEKEMSDVSPIATSGSGVGLLLLLLGPGIAAVAFLGPKTNEMRRFGIINWTENQRDAAPLQ